MLVFAAIDNLWKGAAGQAVQNLNLMLGLDEADGPRDERPRVGDLLPLALGRSPRRASTELDPDALPAGFRAAGVACGIKPSGRLDVGLLACDADDATSAALFTRNAVVAAPVAGLAPRASSRGCAPWS